MQLRHTVEFKVALNGVADVFHGLGRRRALGMAAGQFGATDGNAFRMFEQRDMIFACHLVAGYASALVSSMRSPPISFCYFNVTG